MRTSISRRLTITVLLLELVSAIALVALVTNHERHLQFERLDANLRATSSTLLGAVQEADEAGDVRLDLDGINLPPQAIYSVTADDTQVLGSSGTVPSLPFASDTVTQRWVADHLYRFYALRGERIIDPGTPRAVDHQVTVFVGLPEGRAWHEVFEATRYFAMATVILLGVTALLMTWLIRRFLSPIRALAMEAESIDTEHWAFDAPSDSKTIQELAPLATALEKTIARLHRAFEQQRRFTSDAAHELKTDLAIVKSSFQLLSMKRRSVEEYERGLTLGLTDIARLESTVQKMLTLARLEQSGPVHGEVSDLVGGLQRAVDQCASFAAVKGVQVVVHAADGRAGVMMNDDEAYLLCSNILMNALQHSPDGGTVTAEVHRNGLDVVLVIRDQGAGVAEADLPHLFEPFYRGDASRSRTSGGTGLGLSISKAICERAGGSISIVNHENGGAEVRVVLPAVQSCRLKGGLSCDDDTYG